MDVSEFAELVDGVMSDFSWDDELDEAHRLRACGERVSICFSLFRYSKHTKKGRIFVAHLCHRQIGWVDVGCDVRGEDEDAVCAEVDA